MVCVDVTEVLFEGVRKIVKSDYYLRHVCLSIGLSFHMVHLCSYW
jgi:hypothetical protein